MKTKLNIVLVPAHAIQPYPGNARINDKTVEALKVAIEKYGFNQPLVVDRDFVIVKGHARYQAAVAMGMPEIPCIVSQNSDEINAADRVYDNTIHDLSEWDSESLMAEVRDIQDDLNAVLGIVNEIPQYAPVETQITEADTARALTRQQKEVEHDRQFIEIICEQCGEQSFLDRETVKRAL